LSLVRFVRENVDPEVYFKSVFPDIRWPPGSQEARVHSPWTQERTPSLMVNKQTGAWFSFSKGDQFGGKSIVSFAAALDDTTHSDAAASIFHDFIHPTVDEKIVRRWARRISDTPVAMRYLTKDRLISEEIIRRLRIGWDGTRMTIPIQNEFGLTVNVKFYDPLAKKHDLPKMTSYKKDGEARSYGSPPMLFPLQLRDLLDDFEFVVVCEGEWDALALISCGVLAVTTTMGSKSWPKQYNELFRNRLVLVAADNDEDGDVYARRILTELRPLAREIKRVTIPAAHGKDVTDWLRARKVMRRADMWRKVYSRSPLLIENPETAVEKRQVVQVPLAFATESRHFGHPIRVDALISGKDTAPYLLPEKYRVSCDGECDGCPLVEIPTGSREKTIDTTDPDILKLIDIPEDRLRRSLIQMAGIPKKRGCSAKLEIVSTFNLERLLLIPTLEDGSTGQYVSREAFYVGHGLRTNHGYRFTGVATPAPNDSKATFLFQSATPVRGEVETFELTDTLKRELRRFRPKRRRVLSHLMAIAEWQSRHVTKIRERPDLHVAVDLALHSVSSFEFNGERIDRGMLDVLVIGDTRCGKGYVAERLSRHYGLGEVVSAENCTFAGLVGGVQRVGSRFLITWGVMPLNNGRAVIIDEASAMNHETIGRMSRIRSEGIAEIHKIIRESTPSKVRLVWLSNPASGRSIGTYNTGVESIPELMGANEDVSRFDFAMTVATREVASDIINAPPDDDPNPSRYPEELCRALVLWSWSRRPDQIEFSDEATTATLRKAIELGKRYSPSIPLVQSENIRIKLAKLAASIAARVFSTDDTCEKVLVELDHVECAVEFLDMIYTKESMGYDSYSEMARATSEVGERTRVENVLNLGGDPETRKAAIRGLVELHRITADSLGDFVGDVITAKALISELVKLRCLTRIERGNFYLKNPAFNRWLRAQRIEEDEDDG
jgi:5S rRNA maturation endonuclease (ribonuclease M5)